MYKHPSVCVLDGGLIVFPLIEENVIPFSREFSRENPKFSRFPGNFPGKIEILIIFPGNFPGKTKKLLFSREFSRENRKIYHFPGKFPGKSEQIDSKL